jgi:hypothetical protein
MVFLRFRMREGPPRARTEHNMLYLPRTVAQAIAVSNRSGESFGFLLICVNFRFDTCGEFGSGTAGWREILK